MLLSRLPADQREEQASLVMHPGLPQQLGTGDENIHLRVRRRGRQSPVGKAGWTMDENASSASMRLVKSSHSVHHHIATFRQTWGAVFVQQMADTACRSSPVRPRFLVVRDTTGLAADFGAGAYAWVGEFDPGGRPRATRSFTCQRFGKARTTRLVQWGSHGFEVCNNLLQEDRKVFYADQQALFTADVPVIPLFNRTETFSVRADLTGFAPTPGEEYYVYNANEWAVPGSDTIVLGLTQEPASLFSLVMFRGGDCEFTGAQDKPGTPRSITRLSLFHGGDPHHRKRPRAE
jgi:hypothetical protein